MTSPQDPREDYKDCAVVPTPSVDRVSVKLPPFWADDPEVWFSQIEAQFETSAVKSDATKFNMVIQHLDQNYAKEVRDIILKPPPSGKYDKLKAELIKRLTISRDQGIQQALYLEELGDRKPSQFLRALRLLAGTGVQDEFLFSIWSRRLPTHVNAILAAQKSLSLDEAADMADKICEVMSMNTQQVASTSRSNGSNLTSNNLDDMLQKMEERILARVQDGVEHQLAQLGIDRQRQPRGRSPQRGNNFRQRSRSRRQFSQSRNPGICWYHDTFGGKARKCIEPCNFKAGNALDSQ